MSLLIDKQSAESIRSELDLLKVPPTQTLLEDVFFYRISPCINLASEEPIEFCTNWETFNYIDLAYSFLYVQAFLTTTDGSALAVDSEISPECNFLLLLWSQCDMYLNGILVTQSSNNYPYRVYIENFLSFSKEAEANVLDDMV